MKSFYVGSADLMSRNLDRRVEILFPIEDRRVIRHLRDHVLELYLQDNVKARKMLPDGSYSRKHPLDGEPAPLAPRKNCCGAALARTGRH
jgi:polyphosphate kinase